MYFNYPTAWCFDAVVKVGFRQQTYTILESAEIEFVCVDKNGTTDLSTNVTISGSKSLAHTILLQSSVDRNSSMHRYTS